MDRLEDIEKHVRDREERDRRILFDRQSGTAAKSLRSGVLGLSRFFLVAPLEIQQTRTGIIIVFVFFCVFLLLRSKIETALGLRVGLMKS